MTRLLSVFLTLALLPAVAAGCGGTSESSGSSGSGSSDGGKLNVVAYSTPKEVYETALPAFNKTPEGKGVAFSQSYGASGDQARAVIAGLPADVVALSLAPDIQKLVDEKLVAADWANDEYKGFVSKSVVAFAVRKGNPKNIKTWDDLIKPGVEVIEPNPLTSGGARWNVMAAYGAASDNGADEKAGIDYLKKLFDNVVVQDKSAREALQTFTAGKGDVLIAYENEAITAQQKGEDVDYVVPDQTILIENPIAVTSNSQNPEKAKQLLAYLRSEEAQKVFAEKGYRSVREDLVDQAKYPTPSGLFTIDDLGGWDAVGKKFFDKDKSVIADINKALGVASG
jgi:sulfate transport system substrate-binding protein